MCKRLAESKEICYNYLNQKRGFKTFSLIAKRERIDPDKDGATFLFD